MLCILVSVLMKFLKLTSSAHEGGLWRGGAAARLYVGKP